ncbi:polysaccharide deacetylase family protein [Paenibacillus arenilitoris]|nr:polysaccharide deacetylase family protein [Paenibacillus arenilitoris]
MMFTVDVEDWFCSPQLPLSDWERREIRLERPVRQMLELLDERKALGTFFVLGWIARKRPGLIKEIHRRGHEIASHGYAHRLVRSQSPGEFRQDIRASKDILEDVTGDEVRGYRAPCFSMTEWGLEMLREEGYAYDSSLMPHRFNQLYNELKRPSDVPASFRIKDKLWEIPLPAYRLGGLRVPWGGGGYFRLYPYSLFKAGAKSILRDRGAFVFYIHPYDLDPDQPRIFNSSLLNGFRRYYGLDGTHDKIRRLMADYAVTSIRSQNPQIGESR